MKEGELQELEDLVIPEREKTTFMWRDPFVVIKQDRYGLSEEEYPCLYVSLDDVPLFLETFQRFLAEVRDEAAGGDETRRGVQRDP